MLTKNNEKQFEMEFVMIDQLVADDHLLRAIDKYIDFEFIYELVDNMYSEIGRPSVDPIVLFKMLLIQKLFGISSERRLMKEIQHNVAYRWFLGFGLTTKVPDHSIFSQNKIRRFKESTIFEDIFLEINEQANDYGLIKGKIVYTDSTHIRANASNSKSENEVSEVEIDEDRYLEKVNQVRQRHGIKPLPRKKPKFETKTRKVSTTDPESGFMNRSRKPRGFYWLDHRTVDSSYNIILDTFVTSGNVHDSTVYLQRLDYIINEYKNLPNPIKYACADAGYFTDKVLTGLKERHLKAIIGAPRFRAPKGKDSKYWFSYDIIEDVYVCREGEFLEHKRTPRNGYSEYESDPEKCEKCERKSKCLLKPKDTIRVIRRHVNDEYKEEARILLSSEIGEALYSRRKETVERSFADSKQHHGYRYAHYRGKENVQNEAYLVCVAQNIKKIALVMRSMNHVGKV